MDNLFQLLDKAETKPINNMKLHFQFYTIKNSKPLTYKQSLKKNFVKTKLCCELTFENKIKRFNIVDVISNNANVGVLGTLIGFFEYLDYKNYLITNNIVTNCFVAQEILTQSDSISSLKESMYNASLYVEDNHLVAKIVDFNHIVLDKKMTIDGNIKKRYLHLIDTN